MFIAINLYKKNKSKSLVNKYIKKLDKSKNKYIR